MKSSWRIATRTMHVIAIFGAVSTLCAKASAPAEGSAAGGAAGRPSFDVAWVKLSKGEVTFSQDATIRGRTQTATACTLLYVVAYGYGRRCDRFCPSTRIFHPCFFQTPPAALALASSLGLHLHQVGLRTYTSKLLSMPSTQRSRSPGGRFAWTSDAAIKAERKSGWEIDRPVARRTLAPNASQT